MKQEFCSYEQALALKELGFDERCFGFYDGGDKSLTDTSCRNSEDWLYKNSCTAPLKQQVFRWFREKHEIYAIVFRFHEGFTNEVYQNGKREFGKVFETYEEAEDACIDKLIQILKNK